MPQPAQPTPDPNSPAPTSSPVSSVHWYCFEEADLMSRLEPLVRGEITVDELLMTAFVDATDPDSRVAIVRCTARRRNSSGQGPTDQNPTDQDQEAA